MPRLSLYRPEKGNDYKFIDKTVWEMFQVGGTDVLVHKYIGPGAATQGDTPSTPNYGDSNETQIQDLTKIAGFGFENKDIYLNSYMSIVTESVFFQSRNSDDIFVKFPTGYLSEKLWKPVGHCQPFILAAPAKSLEYIRERFGYKTFHPYIDESYDMENDDLKRLQMIQIEIEKFANKTKEEKDEFLNNVKDICVYNQNLFLQYAKNSYEGLYYNKEMQLILNFLLDGKLEIFNSVI